MLTHADWNSRMHILETRKNVSLLCIREPKTICKPRMQLLCTLHIANWLPHSFLSSVSCIVNGSRLPCRTRSTVQQRTDCPTKTSIWGRRLKQPASMPKNFGTGNCLYLGCSPRRVHMVGRVSVKLNFRQQAVTCTRRISHGICSFEEGNKAEGGNHLPG